MPRMDNKQRLKEVLLRGEPLYFEPIKSEELRTVEASWIAEAARLGQPIQLTNAIVLGEVILALREDSASLLAVFLRGRREMGLVYFAHWPS